MIAARVLPAREESMQMPSRPTDAGALWHRHTAVALALTAAILLASCERTPSKSDYVSAQVTALCEGRTGDALRECRLAVITTFKDTPLEEMQRRFPPPEPRPRPSCGV